MSPRLTILLISDIGQVRLFDDWLKFFQKVCFDKKRLPKERELTSKGELVTRYELVKIQTVLRT